MSAAYHRLTKKMATTLAAAFALSAPAAHAACGQSGSPSFGHERRATIPLQDLDSQGPVFFWHDSSTYALLYFRPEDLVARLESLLARETGSNHDSYFGNASLAPALLDNIKVDLPLRQPTDLFRYTLIDQRFDSVMNLVIADLLDEGKVMLDQWVVAEQPARSIVMITRADADGKEQGLWFCTASDQVLFQMESDPFPGKT